jgi:hypothetical protein
MWMAGSRAAGPGVAPAGAALRTAAAASNGAASRSERVRIMAPPSTVMEREVCHILDA